MMEHAKKLLLVDPARQTASEKKLSKLDEDISRILNSDMPPDKKAKWYSQALQSAKYFDSTRPKQISPETQLVHSMPSNLQGQAKQMLDKIHPFVSWSDSGELVYKDSVVPFSNIAELLTEVLQQRSSQDPDPVGWHEFAQTLKEADVPQELIRRAAARTYINQLTPKVVKKRGRKRKRQSALRKPKPQEQYATPKQHLLDSFEEQS